MPRVTKSAAILFAVLFATAGISAVAGLTITSNVKTTHIGGDAPVFVACPGGSGLSVYLFAGTADGTTTVAINGVNVTLPVGGTVFSAASAVLQPRGADMLAAIPNDPSLIGKKVAWVAVVMDASGQVIAIARTGGPIIEDAIC